MDDDSFQISCECGKRLKIPADKEGKKIRCPGCKLVFIAERPPPTPESIVYEADLERLEKAAKEEQKRLEEQRMHAAKQLAGGTIPRVYQLLGLLAFLFMGYLIVAVKDSSKSIRYAVVILECVMLTLVFAWVLRYSRKTERIKTAQRRKELQKEIREAKAQRRHREEVRIQTETVRRHSEMHEKRALERRVRETFGELTCPKCGQPAKWYAIPDGWTAVKCQCTWTDCGKTFTVRAPTQRQGQPSREPIPRNVQREVWQRDGGQCVRCGSNENLEYDHIVPVSKGGANTVRNIQLLCEPCNRSKGANIGG